MSWPASPAGGLRPNARVCTVSAPYATNLSACSTVNTPTFRLMPDNEPGSRPDQPIGSAGMARLDLRNLPDELKQALVDEATRQDMPYAELARQAIAFYLGWLEAQRRQGPPDQPSD
jgi:hypothetical protein